MLFALMAPLAGILPAKTALAAGDALQADAASLQFDENGYFSVMVIADAQDSLLGAPYLISGIERVLDAQPPDLVILLGDQIEGGSVLLRREAAIERVRKIIDRLLTPIVSRSIPFAVVFGNHDAEAGVSLQEQLEIYRAYPGCMNTQADAYSAFRLPVLNWSGEEALSLYLFESGDYTADGGYACVDAAQVAWYIEESNALREKNNGGIIPAVAFQHIIVGEIYDALQEAPASAEGAVAGVGSGAGRYFSAASDCILTGSLREAPCPSAENNGQFEAFLAQGDVFAGFYGHDHVNDFIVSHRGVDLVACPGATYISYNSRTARGVRVLRFSEDNVRSYETMLMPFSSYESISLPGVIPYYLFTTTQLPAAIKLCAAALLLALAAGALIRACVRAKRRKAAGMEASEAETELPPEFDDPAMPPR